jgi:hypothetical protein
MKQDLRLDAPPTPVVKSTQVTKRQPRRPKGIESCQELNRTQLTYRYGMRKQKH